MNNFRSLLLEIGQHLTQADLSNLKFACSFIPAGRAEFLAQPHELFLEMERQNKLSENNRQLLAELFVKIGRNDLRSKLLGIPDEPPPQIEHSRQLSNRSSRQKVTNDMILQLKLAEKISTNWKFLGRYLGLPDYTLRNVEDTYRRTEERSSEMLSKWLHSSGDTSVGALVTALKNVHRTDLKEEIEDYCMKFPTMADLGHALPEVGQPARGNQANPTEHIDGGAEQQQEQEQQQQQQQQNPDDLVPDRPDAQEDEQQNAAATGPVQVSEEQEEDLKKPGSFYDEKIYRVIDFIGSGGFSRVYCVLEKETNIKFAVKTVELGLNDKFTQEKVQALESEVSMLRVLENPYIVQYFKTKVHKDMIGVFMEYMSGGCIADKILKEGAIKEDVVRNYTWQILNGIKYLHDNKVIHRDIKGANILLDRDHKHLKLTDFGISLALEGIATSTGHCVSNRDGMMASVFWTSPELLCSEKYSFNTDIWSLGCTVVEMLTGDPPLRGDGLVMVQVMFKISNYDVKPPEQCTSHAKDFIHQCFLKRDERPSASLLLNSVNDDEFPFLMVCDN